jgi:large subunit ribosomal protein L23
MATEKKVSATKTSEVKAKKPATKKVAKKVEDKPTEKVEAPKTTEKKSAVKVEKVAPNKVVTVKPTLKDYQVIIEPIITEKSMSAGQTENKATFKVLKDANKLEIRNAIERIYGVKVASVKTVNVIEKATTRGSKYHGTISGYKKAIVRLQQGSAIDLFKE